MQALQDVLVFLILSYSNAYIRVQALPRHACNRGGSRILEWRGQVERRRRECRGAAGVEEVEFGEGCPPPQWGGVWGRGSAPSPENVLIFCLGMVHFASILTRLGSSQGLLQ